MAGAEIAQVGRQFVPEDTVVPVGTTVDLPNREACGTTSTRSRRPRSSRSSSMSSRPPRRWCNEAQGYHLSKALPWVAFLDWAAKWPAQAGGAGPAPAPTAAPNPAMPVARV
ncbi:MAG: hypothetical protein ABIX46_10580 [Burkholderiaceae bacterium]